MRLTTKLVVAVTTAIIVVLVTFGVVRIRREVALFDQDMRRDHRILGLTLQSSIEAVARIEGLGRAADLLAAADRRRIQTKIRWVWVDAEPTGQREGHAPLLRVPTGAAKPELVHIETNALQYEKAEPNEPHLVTYIPLNTPGRRSAIEISESLEPRQNYVRTSVLTTLAALLLVALASSLSILGLGVWLVGRPMALLTAKAREVGMGKLEPPLELRQRDEVGELAAEMNAMCVRLQEANERIHAESAARVAALEQLRHADRLATVGTLSAGIAHEVGTPLNVIGGRARMIARGQANAEQAVEYARIIADQADRVANIIRRLLDFARVREPKSVPFDLCKLAEQTKQLLQPLSEKYNVHVTTELPPSLVAHVDVAQIQQVLTNLVVNAIHASPGGGVVIAIFARRVARADLACPKSFACIEIRDNGCGMTEETKARIFGPFFTTKPVGEGTGLGLSVTEGIVREHGGFIEVQSELEQGSTFTVYLPAEADEGFRSWSATHRDRR